MAAKPWSTSTDTPQARAIAFVADRSEGSAIDPTIRVTVNFHPDRLHDGAPVLQSLASDGVYRSQFETGTGSGSLSAYPGGLRWRWESRMFGGVYDEMPATERPKVGALNYRQHPTGASPRFGSAHLRLRPDVMLRATFCYPDSSKDPSAFGVASRMSLVALAEADRQDALDDYIEAHVHGPLRLADDVEALVLDPCFYGTDVEAVARTLPCALEWHSGFRVHVDVLKRNPSYRGAEYVELGLALARDGYLTPAIIGDAARAGQHDPQDVKKVWHYLARFGDLAAV